MYAFKNSIFFRMMKHNKYKNLDYWKEIDKVHNKYTFQMGASHITVTELSVLALSYIEL
jgi:hypothetical protein